MADGMKTRRDFHDVRLVERAPTRDEYSLLRAEVGWAEIDGAQALRGLSGALFSACLETSDGELIGCARVVGDGGIYFYVQDVIVRAPWRGRGLGALLMDAVMKYLSRACDRNAFVGLMSARGVAGFYHRYGFRERPAAGPGMYVNWPP
jgi:GNAT superfamily N-acetyltransferase